MNDKTTHLTTRLGLCYDFLLSEANTKENDDPQRDEWYGLAGDAYKTLGKDLSFQDLVPQYRSIAEGIARLTNEEIRKGRECLGELERLDLNHPNAKEYHGVCLNQIKIAKELIEKTENFVHPDRQEIFRDSIDTLFHDLDEATMAPDSLDYHNI